MAVRPSGGAMATSANEERTRHALTVAESARLCIESFQTCLDKAALVHYRELSLVEDQLARFSLWTANIRVFGAARSSLDHRLREAPDVQNTVIALLQALDCKVQSCSTVLHSNSSKSTDDGSESISKELDEALGGVANDITLLHKLSNTIRRASKDTQNAKAENTFKIEDDEGNDAESFLQGLFAKHIGDQFPGISDNIQQRLANTMVARRKRLLYRKKRYGKTSIQPRQIPTQPAILPPKPKPRINLPKEPVQHEVTPIAPQSSAQSVTHTATTLNPENFQKASNTSVISVSKTVALTSHDELRFPPPPCGVLLRKYNRLKKEREKLHKEFLEKIPGYKKNSELPPHHRDAIETNELNHKISLEKEWEKSLQAIGEVTCPFCFYALPIRHAVDEKKWKLHVKNDLDPYVCLFEECDSPEQLFSHSDAWLNHMRGHAMRWRCTSKSHNDFVSTTREDYINHMKLSHASKFNDAQLGVLANRNARFTGPLFKSCPLCGVEEIDGSIEEHVVGHMRFLALKSLPSYEEDNLGLDDESDDETNSQATSRPHSRSTVKNDPDRDEPMIFDGSTDNNLAYPRNEGASKYAAWGGLQNYIRQFPEGEKLPHRGDDPSSSAQSSASLLVFPPPLILPIEEDGLFSDSSSEFIDDDLFMGISGGEGERRLFEWGFIPDITGSSLSPTDDPIIQTFLEHQKQKRGQQFDEMTAIDPDCAICHAPATAACDCEAKGLEVAVAQAEKRMMSSVYGDVREWVRSKSKELILQQYSSLQTISHQSRMQKAPRGDSVDTSSAVKFSQQETNEMWQTAYQMYPESLDYFYSLVEFALPAEDEPAVRDPPLSALTGHRKAKRRLSTWYDTVSDTDQDILEASQIGSQSDNHTRKRGKGDDSYSDDLGTDTQLYSDLETSAYAEGNDSSSYFKAEVPKPTPTSIKRRQRPHSLYYSVSSSSAAIEDALQHSKIYTTEESFPCTFPDCSMKFGRSEYMEQHLETHYRRKPVSQQANTSAPRATHSGYYGVTRNMAGSRADGTVFQAGPSKNVEDLGGETDAMEE